MPPDKLNNMHAFCEAHIRLILDLAAFIYLYCGGAGEKLKMLMAPIRGFPLCHALSG
jgi:hypothetical protein